MSVMNLVASAVDDLLARRPARPTFRVVPKAKPGCYRGKRARRQAFYGRQRMGRLLQRIVNAQLQPTIDMDAQVDDLLRYGTTWIEVSEAGARRMPPSEWRAVDFAESRGLVPR